MNFAYHDYEFTKVSEPELRLVSCSILNKESHLDFWLDQDNLQKQALREYYLDLKKNKVVLVAFNVEAEARSMIDLGLNPLEFEWVDLYLEFIMMMNHNHEIGFGEHYVDGRIKKLNPYKDEKPNASLATSLYKMLQVKIDTAHKDQIRDLTISSPDIFTPEERKAILDYGNGDVKFLPKLWEAIINYYKSRMDSNRQKVLFDEIKRRARYSVRSAYMVKRGYPINVQWAKNFSGSTGALIDALIRDILEQFKDQPDFLPFKWNKKEFRWSMNQSNIRNWIRASGNAPGWPLTEGGADGSKKDLSLSSEAFEDRFDYSHTYPRGVYGAQMVRYFKLIQSLNGFKKTDEEVRAISSGKKTPGTKKKKKFWDYVGSDGRVRPYFGIFTAQSSRSQPAATGYIMLKPAWQRSIIQPQLGKVILGCDYSSQEFLLSALFSKDKKMLASYRSGDVYLAFGKEIGLIPKDGTKQTHKFERDACKATVLGLSYLMTEVGLARKLTADTGRVWTEAQAKELVDKFDQAYPDFSYWRKEKIQEYYLQGYLKLQDGWHMSLGRPDNSNKRSVGNMPVQGAGADIMRRAVELCEEAGLPVIMTLHDALYVEIDFGDYEAVRKFNVCMKQAFISYFPNQQADAEMIRTDVYGWGPDYDHDQEIEIPECGKVFFSKIYIDERAADEFEKFQSYFSSVPGGDVL